jgi:hypothetical protein
MAQAGETLEHVRRETVDTTSSSPRIAGSGRWGGYLGIAIAGLILVGMVFLQNAASSIF